jgi:hypothetical protein
MRCRERFIGLRLFFQQPFPQPRRGEHPPINTARHALPADAVGKI